MVNIFHQHLDVCRQCRECPMQLCPEGAKLLKKAALGHKPHSVRGRRRDLATNSVVLRAEEEHCPN